MIAVFVCVRNYQNVDNGNGTFLQRLRQLVHLVAKNPSFLHADSEDSDQTGRTYYFVGFVMLRLILSSQKLPNSVSAFSQRNYVFLYQGLYIVELVLAYVRY